MRTLIGFKRVVFAAVAAMGVNVSAGTTYFVSLDGVDDEARAGMSVTTRSGAPTCRRPLIWRATAGLSGGGSISVPMRPVRRAWRSLFAKEAAERVKHVIPRLPPRESGDNKRTTTRGGGADQDEGDAGGMDFQQ